MERLLPLTLLQLYKMSEAKQENTYSMIQLISSFAKNTLGLELLADGNIGDVEKLNLALNKLSEEINLLKAKNIRPVNNYIIEDEFVFNLINSAPDGIVAVNNSGRIILFNKQAETLFGYTSEEIIGERIEKLMPAKYRQLHALHTESYFHTPSMRKMGALIPGLVGLKKNNEEFSIDISLIYIEQRGEKITISSIRDISATNKLHKEVAANEILLKEITSVIPAVVFQSTFYPPDMQHEFRFINQASRHVLGIDPVDIMNGTKLPLSLIHPDDIVIANEAIALSNKTGEKFSYSFRIIMEDGSIKWIQASGLPRINENGSVTRTGCFIDITESRNIKRSLEESVVFKRNLLDSLISQIAVLSYNGEIIDSNKVWEESVSDILPGFAGMGGKGTNFFNNCANAAKGGDHYAQHVLDAIKLVTGREKDVIEIEYTREISFRSRWYALRIMAFNIDAPYFVLSNRDITQRKTAELKIRNSEQRYKKLLDTTDEMINTVSYEGKLLWVNNSWKKNMKYDDSELSNLKLFDLLTEESKVGFKERIEQLRNKIPIYNLNASLVAKDGSIVDLNGSIIPYFEDGIHIGNQGFFRNITEVNKAYADRIKLETRLSNILDNMLTGCMVIGADWRYIYSNATAAEHAFQKVENLIGNSVFDMFPGFEFSSIFQRCREVSEHRKLVAFKDCFTFQNGITKWFELVVEPIEEGIFIMSVDITDKKNIRKYYP